MHRIPLLRERRKELGLTLNQLSSAIGISLSHMQKVEKGVFNPSMGLLKALHNALGDFRYDLDGMSILVTDASSHISGEAYIVNSEIEKTTLRSISEYKEAMRTAADLPDCLDQYDRGEPEGIIEWSEQFICDPITAALTAADGINRRCPDVLGKAWKHHRAKVRKKAYPTIDVDVNKLLGGESDD